VEKLGIQWNRSLSWHPRKKRWKQTAKIVKILELSSSVIAAPVHSILVRRRQVHCRIVNWSRETLIVLLQLKYGRSRTRKEERERKETEREEKETEKEEKERERRKEREAKRVEERERRRERGREREEKEMEKKTAKRERARRKGDDC
jgi:hypothetical protein